MSGYETVASNDYFLYLKSDGDLIFKCDEFNDDLDHDPAQAIISDGNF